MINDNESIQACIMICLVWFLLHIEIWKQLLPLGRQLSTSKLNKYNTIADENITFYLIRLLF